ncbi:MAG TPA: hypothetical protein VEH31_38985 [Streptosporangiaceae bacterium]|nr:hypothetical protein [Streptosporangiaceae bacterium]
MQDQHDRHGSLIVDGHDTGHDPGRAERDQAADQAQQLVGAHRRGYSGVAAGQDQPVGCAGQPLEVVHGQRPIVEPQ